MLNKLYIVILCCTFFGAYSVIVGDDEKPVKAKKTYVKKSADEIVNVRVLSQTKATSLLIAPQKGVYQIYADGKMVVELNEQAILKATLVNDSIELKTFENFIGKCRSFKVVSMSEERTVKLKMLQPDRKPRYFDDNMSISIEDLQDGKTPSKLRIINNTQIDHYIAGVSEAEAGSHSTVEFYKVQSILARTYALAHLYKHGPEGYNLCDQVHCQAFYGKSHDAEILEAVAGTKGMVVVDENLQLITAAFHSNSGGETVNSEDVWGAKTSYLKTVKDSFSLKMPNARWERKMLAEDWLTYLKLKHNYPIDDSSAKTAALNFKQDSRKINFEYASVKVPLKVVRTDLQLKSTFFSLEQKGDTILFRGKGFGHGIGMCQEGAMRMTKLGYKYKDVLNFYYKNVHIINLKELSFFKE
ncbi:MAG: SpoIID/LytB domain-containing protein [Bacteroidota bacterium]|nr:SpoIID/LytB domain-containing protein [Bacteroidota bacterium]